MQEYFAYDPNEPLLLRRANRRLFGWQLDASGRDMKAMPPRPDGSLWRPSLESWLMPDRATLRLYDRDGLMRLTHAEAEAQRADAAIRQAQVLAEKLRSLGVDPDQLI